MNLKDYYRVIRRRSLELLSVFALILILYFYVSYREAENYLATVNLRVGEKVSRELNEPNILFLRNRNDLESILKNKGPSSIYYEVARHVRYKIELARSVDSIEKLEESQAKLFYSVSQRAGFVEVESQRENFKDLNIGTNYLVSQLRKRDDQDNLENIETEIAKICRKITLSNPSDTDTNVLTLNLKTGQPNLSRWLVNETAFFVAKKFNELNNENAHTRMRQIDLFYDSDKRNDIERDFNEIVFMYRDFLSSNENQDRQNLESQLREKFPYDNFDKAFNIDYTRRNLKKIIETSWRYKNAQTFNETGVISLDEKQNLLAGILSRIEGLKANQIRLDEERLLLEMKFSKFSKDEREFLFETSENLQNLLQQSQNAQLKIEDLKRRYTSQHPKVKATRRQIENLNRMVDELKARFNDIDNKRHVMRLKEIEFQKNFNARLLDDLDSQEAQCRQEIQRLQDMKMYLDVIKSERDRLLKRSVTLNEELQGLRRIVELEKVVKLDRPAQKSFMLPKTYTSQTLWLTVIVGAIISVFFVYIREYTDTTIRTEHDVRRHVNLPLLSIVSRQSNDNTLLSEMKSSENFNECFNSAATLIESASKELKLKTFMVGSSLPKEGKTTVATNLAIALARKGNRVLLVDGDFRIPRVHEYLKIDNSIGLSTWLAGRLTRKKLKGASPASVLFQKSKIPNLTILCSGPVPENPMNLLSTKRMKNFITRSKKCFDYILIDSPPVNNVADGLTIASLVDAVLFVVGSEIVQQDNISWAKHLLQNVNANILGAVLNSVRISSLSYDYYYNNYKSYRARG